MSVPGASHMNHMPSHTWNEMGRWNDGVRANLQAWHSDLKAAIGEGFAIYPDHNLHMLLFAASNDGQGGIATQAGKDYAKSTGDTMYQVLTLLRFGRFDEIAEITKRPERDVAGGMWDFAQGYAKLRAGQIDFARLYLSRVKKAETTSKQQFRAHDAKVLLGVASGILEGEILRATGDQAGALAAFERAVAADDQIEYDEPEPLHFDSRQWLGAMQLEAGRRGRRRGDLPQGTGRASQQRLVAARPGPGAEGAGEAHRRGRRRVREGVGALRHVDSRVALLTMVSDSGSAIPAMSSRLPRRDVLKHSIAFGRALGVRAAARPSGARSSPRAGRRSRSSPGSPPPR